MIVIKPHHLIDIMKLYGAGVEHFVPDELYQHDFYKVANHIIENLDTELQFTIYGMIFANRVTDSKIPVAATLWITSEAITVRIHTIRH